MNVSTAKAGLSAKQDTTATRNFFNIFTHSRRKRTATHGLNGQTGMDSRRLGIADVAAMRFSKTALSTLEGVDTNFFLKMKASRLAGNAKNAFSVAL
ncbi:hypothetical protein IB243_07540 [Acidovorax sp. ACV01]|nr:hypothetical protein [Acidovorax sp. ACV01]